MKKLFVIFVCMLMVATVFGMSMVAVTGKPGGGGGKEREPADPAIAYQSLGPGLDLIVMNADGSNKVAIVEGAAHFPAWSPDGEHIAYVYRQSPTDTWGLWRIDVSIVDGKPQGSNAQLLVSSVTTQYGQDPVWSPADDVIAYITGPTANNPCVIWTVSVNGGTPTQLLSSSNYLRYLAWNHDGTEIAYIENIQGSGKCIKILTLSTDETRTVYGPVSNLILGLDWARTQDKLVFETDYNSQGYGLYTLDLIDELATPQFIISTLGSSDPTWSPDDTHIAYMRITLPSGSTKGPEKHDIMSIELSTGTTKLLAKESRMPDWRRPTDTWPA